jgi:hypothetical protein
MPTTGDRRSRERFGFIDQCMTITYNALRKHSPETMGLPRHEEEKPKAMAAAA